MNEAQREHRVVAAVLIDRSAVLLCHRRADRRWYPDCWDLPGGHVEYGETDYEALRRECAEELGIDVVLAEPLPFAVGDPAISMTVMRVVAWDGTPKNVAPEEHDRIAWVGPADLASLPVADARYRDLLARLVREHGGGPDGAT